MSDLHGNAASIPLPDDRLGHEERMALTAGSGAGWERAYRRIHGPLYGYCLKLTGSETQALDLTQEAFLRTMRRCRERGTPAGLRAFLFTTARNLHLDEVERGRRRHHGDIGELDDVREALAALPDRQRQALAMCDMEQCTYAEAGAVLGLGESAVAQLVFRARARLRVALGMRQIDESSLPEACRANLESISRKLDGQLRGAAAEALAAHLAACAECRGVEESFALVQRRYRGFLPLLPIGVDDAWAEVASRAEHEGLVEAGDWDLPDNPHDPVLARARAAGRQRRPRSRAWRLLLLSSVVALVLGAGAGGAYVYWESGDGDRDEAAASDEPVATSGNEAAEEGVTDSDGEASADVAEPGTDSTTPAADPGADEPPPATVAAPANLRVSGVSWSGGRATISVVNDGASPAGESTVSVAIGATSWSGTASALAPGAGTTVTVDTGCRDGTFTVVARADAGNAVGESDESDNERSGTFSSVC